MIYDILFVTSMTDRMYNMYGKKLIDDINFPCVVCTENIEHKICDMQYDILKDQWLLNWLEKHKNLIPTEYGGTCNNTLEYFNYNSSKWMRKVASLKYAVENYKWNILVWIDADCVILENWNNQFVYESFTEKSICFYHQGPKREKFKYGFETGIFGIKKEGVQLLHDFFKFYDDDFKKLKRWDDGFVFRHCVKISKYITNDLCSENANLLKPLNCSIWSKYVKHNKGKHRDAKVHH